MKAKIKQMKKRLDEAEQRGDFDPIAKLPFIDYLGLEDYDTEPWEEVYRDGGPYCYVAVMRNNETGEVRGVFLQDVKAIVEAGLGRWL